MRPRNRNRLGTICVNNCNINVEGWLMQLLINELISYAVGQLEMEAQTNYVQLRSYAQYTSDNIFPGYSTASMDISTRNSKSVARKLAPFRKKLRRNLMRIVGPHKIKNMKVQGKPSNLRTTKRLKKGDLTRVGATHKVSPVPMRCDKRSANRPQQLKLSVSRRVFNSQRPSNMGEFLFTNEVWLTTSWRTPSETLWNGYCRQETAIFNNFNDGIIFFFKFQLLSNWYPFSVAVEMASYIYLPRGM